MESSKKYDTEVQMWKIRQNVYLLQAALQLAPNPSPPPGALPLDTPIRGCRSTGGAENDGHENAGHVSGVWIGPTTLNTEHCRMHGIVSETFDISWYSYTWYFRWYFI